MVVGDGAGHAALVTIGVAGIVVSVSAYGAGGAADVAIDVAIVVVSVSANGTLIVTNVAGGVTGVVVSMGRCTSRTAFVTGGITGVFVLVSCLILYVVAYRALIPVISSIILSLIIVSDGALVFTYITSGVACIVVNVCCYINLVMTY